MEECCKTKKIVNIILNVRKLKTKYYSLNAENVIRIIKKSLMKT